MPRKSAIQLTILREPALEPVHRNKRRTREPEKRQSSGDRIVPGVGVSEGLHSSALASHRRQN